MPRYIDADALMAQLNRKKAEPCNKRYTEGFNDALMRFRSMIHSAPAVSPDEVRGVGKWILVDEMNDEVGAHLRYIYCSVCGGFALLEGRFGKEYKSSYCPHCGAKMEVER